MLGVQFDDLQTRVLLLFDFGRRIFGRHVHVLAFQPNRLLFQESALSGGEFAPGVGAEDHTQLNGVKARLNAEFGFFMPAQIKNAQQGPAVAVDHAALQGGVDLTRCDLNHVGTQLLEEIAVNGRNAQFQASEVGLVDAFVAVDVVLNAFAGAGVVVQTFFHHDFVQVVDGTVFAHLSHGLVGVVDGQAFGNNAGHKRGGGVGHVHHTTAQGIALLKGGDGLGATDVIDLDQALAFVVDLFHEAFKVAGVIGALLKSVHRLEGDLLGLRGQGGGERSGGHAQAQQGVALKTIR